MCIIYDYNVALDFDFGPSNSVVSNMGALTKLLGLRWQGAPYKDVFGEYRVRFPGGTTLGKCACLYARAGLVAHLSWVGTGAKAKKKIGINPAG
jgi:hypothetical protein